MKNIVVEHSKSALKFLTDNANALSFDDANALLTKAVRKLLRYEDNNADAIALHDKLKGMYRLRRGNARIVFTLRNGVAVVVVFQAIDFRWNIYSNAIREKHDEKITQSYFRRYTPTETA